MPCAIGVRDDLGSYAARVAATACDDRARSNRACPPARLLLARGDVAAAGRWTQEHGLGPEDKPGYPQELEYLVLARVLVALGRPGGRGRCWTGWAPGRRRKIERAESSRSRRCRRWRWRRAATGPPRPTPWPGRSPWPANRARCGSSPTKGRRRVPCSGASLPCLPSELGGTWVPRCRPRRFHPANTPSADALGGAGS